jgi:hypothetical protein
MHLSTASGLSPVGSDGHRLPEQALGYPEVGLHSQLSAKVAKMPLDNVAWFR